MRIDKYLICGGEDLSILIKSNQSPDALGAFKKWRPFCSESCNKIEKDCLLYIPLSNGNYFLMKSVFENRSGARALTWTIGIELTKSELLSIGSYDSMSKGFRNISINQIKEAYESNGNPFDVNFRFPQNTFIEDNCLEDVKDKDFKGEYPQILDEFTGKLRNCSIEVLIEKLCVVVNPHEYCEEFSCMMGSNIPPRLIKKQTKPVEYSDIIQEKSKASNSMETTFIKSKAENKNGLKTVNDIANYFIPKNFFAVIIMLVVSICLNIVVLIKNVQLSKSASEKNLLEAARSSLEKENKKQNENIISLKEKIVQVEEERNKANNENTQTQKKFITIKTCLEEMKKSSKGLKTKIDNLEDGDKKYGNFTKDEWNDNHSNLVKKITEIDKLLN